MVLFTECMASLMCAGMCCEPNWGMRVAAGAGTPVWCFSPNGSVPSVPGGCTDSTKKQYINVSATMSQTEKECMAIIKLVAAVKIDTQSGAATKDDEVIAEYFSAAVSV